MILRTPVALHGDVNYEMHRDFCNINIVIFAVYFPTWCQPCIIQKTHILIICFCGPLRLLFDIFPFYTFLFCRALLSQDNFYGTLGCACFMTFYFLAFTP